MTDLRAVNVPPDPRLRAAYRLADALAGHTEQKSGPGEHAVTVPADDALAGSIVLPLEPLGRIACS